MIQKWFNCSEYQARQALLLKKNKGLLAFSAYFNGNKPLSDDIIKLVTEYYLQDGISRASSRQKDIIHINKVPVPVRFMEISGREAFRQLIDQNPTATVGKSSFYALRPRQGWNKFLKNNILDHDADLELVTDKYLIDRIVCSIPVENYFLRRFGTCSIINPSDILLENININKDEHISWSSWKTINNKVDLHQINGSTNSLLHEIDSQWSTFLLHWFHTKEQKEYIKSLRINSSQTTYIVAQLDFAENFTLFRQREVQGYHWNNQQVTIFTVHLKIGSIHQNIVLISDYMSHNTTVVLFMLHNV
ncbi:unnamed protein product [Rotaria sp. Silwood2]|nr:unnamed protein product [Rotaria sp. Silwood2]CAF3950055.1 unnamed protein product [Rotaria sp. Silwood2]